METKPVQAYTQSVIETKDNSKMINQLRPPRFMIIILLFSLLLNATVGLSWNGETVAQEPLTQEQLIAKIKKLGGEVTVDDKNPDRPIIGISFYDTSITDADLKHLKRMTSIQELHLDYTGISNADINTPYRLNNAVKITATTA